MDLNHLATFPQGMPIGHGWLWGVSCGQSPFSHCSIEYGNALLIFGVQCQTGPGHHGDDEYEYEIHHFEKFHDESTSFSSNPFCALVC